MTKPKFATDYGMLSRKYGTYIMLAIIVIFSTILKPDIFLTKDNIISILVQVSMFIILACGEALVIIGGGTDLSAGSMVAMAGTIMVGIYVQTGSILISLIATLILGMCIGFINGFLISRFNLIPFIVTLGTQILARGIAYVYSDGMPIPLPIEDTAFRVLGQGKTFGIPNPIYVAALVVIITSIIANRTAIGRAIYATGGNKEAARASGIKVNRVTTFTYVYMGLLGGITGYVLMSRINVGQPNAAVNYEFDAIIGVILGGASFSGGIGTISGSVLGCIIMGVLGNIMNLTNVPPNWQYVVKGVIILFAVTFDALNKEISEKRSIKAQQLSQRDKNE